MTTPRQQSPTPDARDARRYDEEHQALEGAVREYIDLRLRRLSIEPPGRSRAREDHFAASSAASDPWRWRTDVYFLVTLALIALLWWRTSRPPEPGVVPVATTTTTEPTSAPGSVSPPVTPPPSPAPVEPAAATPPVDFDNPETTFDDYLRRRPEHAARWLTAISNARGLNADRVSERQKANFGRWSSTLFQQGSLGPAELANVRIGLFEYVYGRWLGNLDEPPPGDPGAGWDKVDLVVNPGEYSPAALTQLVTDLGLGKWFSEPLAAEDRALQVAVILGWIDTRQP